MSTLAERVTERMKALGLNNAALAALCGVKPPTSYNWAHGRTQQIKGEPLLRAAAALGVNAHWLATGKGPKSPTDIATAHAVSDPPPPAYMESPKLQEALALLRQLSPDQLNEAISFLRWQVANRAPPSDGQALPLAA